VAMVRKLNFSGFASGQGNNFGSFVLDSLGHSNNQHHADNQPGNRFRFQVSSPLRPAALVQNRTNTQQTV